MKNKYQKLVYIFALLLLIGVTAFAQLSSELWIKVKDDDAPKDSVWLGYGNHINATYGTAAQPFDSLNPKIVEREAPPPGPGFDVRFINIPGHTNVWGGGLFPYDFRKGDPLLPHQSDTFRIKIDNQNASASNFTLRWDTSKIAPRCDSLIMWIPNFKTVNMRDIDSVYIPNAVDNGYKNIYIWKFGVKLIDGLPPSDQPITMTFPPNNATNVDISPPLQWNKDIYDPPMKYRVQLSRDAGFTQIVKDTTTRYTFLRVSLQECVTYYWRVQATNDYGTGPWPPSPFSFTVVLAIPGVPNLISPANDTLNVLPTPTLSWNPLDFCAATYRLQVAKDTGFTIFVLNTTTNQTYRTMSTLEQNVYYYWRVKAFNAAGDSSQYTPYNKFKTILLPPAVPPLVSPANGDTTQDPVLTLKWRKTIYTDNYTLQISADQNFISYVFNDTTGVDTSHVTTPLAYCTRYYWRVKSKNASGESGFSQVWNFKIRKTSPAQPTLQSPANDTINVSPTPTLSWTSADVCSEKFRLQVAKDTAFTIIVVDAYTAQVFSTLGTLEQNAIYFWRVKSLNSLDSSLFTQFRKFKTILYPPQSPQLVTPADGDTTQDPTGTLRWSKTLYTDFYHLQISKNQNFTTVEFSDSTLTDTSTVTISLGNCNWYYWRVKAKNSAGASGFTSARNFRVRTAIPGSPNMISPVNNQDSLLETVRLIWNKGDLCTYNYSYHVSRNSLFTDTVAIGTIADTTIQIGPIVGNVYYFWHVRANNYLGEGPFSATWQFHTTRSRPAVPTLIFPADGVPDMPSVVTLRWDSAAFADYYRVQLALDSAFTMLKLNDSTIARQSGVQPSRQVTSLLNSTTYFWRVMAKNEIGISEWSPIRRFTTLFPPTSPTLNLPVNGATSVAITPVFDWSMAQRANVYRLQVATDTVFSNMVFDDSTIAELSWQLVNPLESIKKYFWKVCAKNNAGWGQWSRIFSFITTRSGLANWLVPVKIMETGSASDIIYFGVHPNATNGIDPTLGEYELAPIQFGMFDARFVSPFIGEGLRIDIVKFIKYSQIDTFQFSFQPGYGTYPMKISWPRSFIKAACDSMVMIDQFIGGSIHIRMDQDSTLSVSDVSIRSLYIVKYGAFPMPLDVKPSPRELPKGFALYQNYPNPFNPTTKIDFSTDQVSLVNIKVYDLLGREIAVLVNSAFFPGQFSIEWNGKNQEGMQMPSGVYYVRMIASPLSKNSNDRNFFTSTRKMLMMK